MKEFTTYVFKENEVRTHNAKIVRERTYYIGILIFISGFALALLDFSWGWFFVFIGIAVYLIGGLVMSGRDSSIGHKPLSLTISRDSVTIGKEMFPITSINDVEFKIIGYKGQLMVQRIALYKTFSGNDNIIKVRYNTLESEFRFVLDSEIHKERLVQFCTLNGFRFEYGAIQV